MSAVKVYDANGRDISTIGRSGDGSGEFRQLRAVCVAPGDTIIAIGCSATPCRTGTWSMSGMGSAPKGPSSVGERRLEFVRKGPQPASIPIYFEIQVENAGRIWVQDRPIEGPAPWKWIVRDSTGRA